MRGRSRLCSKVRIGYCLCGRVRNRGNQLYATPPRNCFGEDIFCMYIFSFLVCCIVFSIFNKWSPGHFHCCNPSLTGWYNYFASVLWWASYICLNIALFALLVLMTYLCSFCFRSISHTNIPSRKVTQKMQCSNTCIIWITTQADKTVTSYTNVRKKNGYWIHVYTDI